MRNLEVSRERWNVLFTHQQTGLDLRQAVKDLKTQPTPCDDGLRSVCWKVRSSLHAYFNLLRTSQAFLLYGTPNQASWSKKLLDSRRAYSSLCEHFLKFIEHPNDLQSTVDPLAEDTSVCCHPQDSEVSDLTSDKVLKSPWSTLRQDEANRREIFQDVERCMQDNSFFQEPSTQKTLLDILFIYSKLHPDIGYRQGMHELLAPILWVVNCDTIESSMATSKKAEDAFMMDVLDQKFVAHDAFTLFCAVMQTAKSFYEIGDSGSLIVERSRRIHNEYLGEVDPELANHLQVIEILPQIFLLRWIRLLFGREFNLNDTLSVWDVLFAENLSLSLVDMTCLAMLLRIRWQLLQADHAEALHLLLRYEPPLPPNGPATLVQDAMYLERNRTFEAGARLVARYSGLEVDVPEQRQPPARRPPSLQLNQRYRGDLGPASRSSRSPGNSPGRFLSPQAGLETLFQEISGTLQKRTEGWKVPRAVRQTVGEVRRNVNKLQSGTALSSDSLHATHAPLQQSTEEEVTEDLKLRLSAFEQRNKVLARMLGDALEELRAQKQPSGPGEATMAEESSQVALAKMQFVQVCLADPELSMPGNDRLPVDVASESLSGMPDSSETEFAILPGSSDTRVVPVAHREGPVPGRASKPPIAVVKSATTRTRARGAEIRPVRKDEKGDDAEMQPSMSSSSSSSQRRPVLSQSPLSWMLEGHKRSDFVSSSTPPPEQSRDHLLKVTRKPLFPDEKGIQGRDDLEDEDDGFSMNSLHGSQSIN